MSICLSVCLSVFLSNLPLSLIYLICLSNYVSTYLPIYLSIYLSIYLCLSVCLPVCLIETFKPQPSCCDILALKSASCHNGAQFFNIRTAKTGPKLAFFVHFDLAMCFAPHGLQFFDIWTSKRGPRIVFLARLTWKCPSRHTACNFQTSDLPKVVRSCVLHMLTWKCALVTTARNVSFLIWPDGSAPATLASLLFEPPTHTSLEKHNVSRLSQHFAPVSSICWLFPFLSSTLLSSTLIFSLTLPISAFHLSILSEVWHLKLPLMNQDRVGSVVSLWVRENKALRVLHMADGRHSATVKPGCTKNQKNLWVLLRWCMEIIFWWIVWMYNPVKLSECGWIVFRSSSFALRHAGNRRVAIQFMIKHRNFEN